MNFLRLLPVHLAGAIALATSSASAQGGGLLGGPGNNPFSPPPVTNPGGPTPPPNSNTTRTAERDAAPMPGSMPALLYSEERWEFWWEFNHDAFVNLRPGLLHAPVHAGAAPFSPVDADAKSQVLLPHLIELLRDREDWVRSAAALSLARLQDPSVLPYLSNAAVGDPSLLVRTHALLAMGLTRAPKAVERLKVTMLDDRAQDEARCYAAVALGVNGSPEGSAALRDALVGGAESGLPYSVRLAATWALGLARDAGNAPFLKSLVHQKGADETEHALAVEALGRVGDRAVNPLLIEALNSPHAGVRRSAAIVLGGVARPEDADVVKELERALVADSDQTVRSFAAISLGRIAAIGSPQIVERLRARLRTESARQRSFIALALGISGYQSAEADLLAEFRSEGSESMRGALATALGLLDQKEAIPDLRAAFLKEKSPILRGYLAYALGRLGDVTVADELRKIVGREKQPQLLYWSSVALGLLGDRPAQDFLAEKLGEDRGDQVTRGSWIYALGSIGDREAAGPLLQLAHSESETAFLRAMATAAAGMLVDEDRVPPTATFSRDHNYTLSLTFLPQLYNLF
jgi:HEAT repeat protein